MTHTGRHFLQIPGPTNVPDRVLKEIAQPTIDHRGPEFAELGLEVLDGLKGIFRTRGPVVVFPASGTGAAEAALVNTLSPGDRVLIFETGWFSHVAWRQVAERLGLNVEYVPGTWRRGASPEILEQRLKDDTARELKAVVVVHNETSTGVVSRIADLRRAMNRTRPSRAVDRRRHFIAGLGRSPPRRVGDRRHRLRLAEGADGAAGTRLQRDL